MRVTTIEDVNNLVNIITEAVTPENIDNFLKERLIPYNKEKRTNTALKLRSGIYYLPSPFNSRLIAKLKSYRDNGGLTDINDEYGC